MGKSKHMSMEQINELAKRANSGDKLAYRRLSLLVRKHPQVKALAKKVELEANSAISHRKGQKRKVRRTNQCPSTINGLTGITSSRPWSKTK